jgi:hypothetical protein
MENYAYVRMHYIHRFLQEVIFTYTLSVYLFRAGVRRNNHDVIMAARLKFVPLYFGTHKFNYQQIEVLDLLMRVCAPSEVSKFIHDNESLTRKCIKIYVLILYP